MGKETDMIDVLLVNPSIPPMIRSRDLWVPINLMYLSATLKKHNISVKIIDLNINSLEQLLDQIRTVNPSIVGVTCIFSGQFLEARYIIKTVKKMFPFLYTVLGGIHPTIYAEKIVEKCDEIDYVILGEGEYSFLKLVNNLLNKIKVNEISGIVYRNHKKIIKNPKKDFINDLDSLPFPSYDLINLDDYELDTTGWHNPRRLSIRYMIPILSSRSCPMRCNFCSMFQSMGKKQRFRSPENIVDEIEYIYHKYDAKRFAFIDDNLTIKKSHVVRICEDILRRGLNIQWETPNGIFLPNLEKDVINLMVRSGLIRVSLAIESGSDFIRNDVVGKHLSRDKIYEVVKYFKNYPWVYMKAFFIIGFPEETPESLQETYNMIKEIKIHYPCVSNLLPFPGTRLFEQAIKDNLIVENVVIEDLWERSDFYFTDNKKFFIKPYNMDIKELEKFRFKIDSLIRDIKI